MSNEITTKPPLVSIVTPSFNQSSYIEETILSVQNAGYPYFEHIIVDGGSTDATLSILKKYPHLRWVSEPDNGQSDALNKGFGMATGEIIGWLNSDDCYYRDAILRVVCAFNQNSTVDFIYGNLAFIDDTSDIKSIWHVKTFDIEQQLNDHNLIAQPSVFFKKSLLNKVGYLNIHLRYTMDVDLWNRMYFAGATMHRIDKVLSLFREHPTSKTIAEGDKFWKELRATSRNSGSRFYNIMLQRHLYENYPGSRLKQLIALIKIVQQDQVWGNEYFGHG